MRAFSKAPLGALVAAVTLLAACNKAPENATPATTAPAAPVVAIVNGVSLTRPEFDIYEKNLMRNAKVESLTADQQNQVLDELITMQVMAAQGEKDGLENDPETKAQLALLHMRVLADAESQKFVKSQTPSDADLHAEYETAISQMDKNEYHARHILVPTKEQAEQIIKKLKNGAKFEDLAKSQSTDTGSKNNGGDLGWFTTSRMVKPFADAVKSLKKGEADPGADAVRLARDPARGYPRSVAAGLRSSEAAAHRSGHAQEAASVRGGLEKAGEDREEARCPARRPPRGRPDGTRHVGAAGRRDAAPGELSAEAIRSVLAPAGPKGPASFSGVPGTRPRRAPRRPAGAPCRAFRPGLPPR
jgi:peptidyl-prolyl cis-trans isomerase C